MSASVAIAMVGVAAMAAVPLVAWITRDSRAAYDLSGLAVIAVLSIVASCMAANP